MDMSGELDEMMEAWGLLGDLNGPHACSLWCSWKAFDE